MSLPHCLAATETLAPDPEPNDDESVRLAAQVGRRLGSQVREFYIEVRGDGLVLRGRVSSYYAKLLAQHEVMKATPLLIAANEITVIPDLAREAGKYADH